MAFYKGQSFDNTYPSITRIANEFMTTRPYAIDNNGKPLDKAVAVDSLYHPNQQMSSADFREALAVMTLVHRKVYLLVWHNEGGKAVPGGNITPDNIAGFTFLEGVAVTDAGGKKTYNVGSESYGSHEVIEIYAGVDPYNLSGGYSPSVAANKWASLDDYIAAYEAGLFENGAVPAGQFIVTAPSIESFNETVDDMERHHRGSGKNNNVMYTHRPISLATGMPVNAEVEWIPFAQTNKDMKLGEIFDQANKKVDSAFGVPASIRGVNDNNTYASVRVDEQIFMRYTVLPFTTKIWTRITHELNRITGGLGYAITFDMNIPGVADERKVEAERKMMELSIINQATMAGFSLDSIVDAFELSDGYKLLKHEYKPSELNNDRPEVDEGDEVEASPDSADESSRKVIMPKTKSGDAKKSNPDNNVIEDIAEVLRRQNQNQIDRAIQDKAKDAANPEEQEIDTTTTELLNIIVAYVMIRGAVNYSQGTQLLRANNISIENLTEYTVTEEFRSKYRAYLTNVARSYANDTAKYIRDVLARGQTEEWSKETLAQKLRDIMNTDEWRVQRLARTEEQRAVGQASVDAMTQVMNESGTTIYKVWHTNSGDPCEFCSAMVGKKEVANESFLRKGESINGTNGGKLSNDFADIDTASMHPNCHCYIQYEVEK